MGDFWGIERRYVDLTGKRRVLRFESGSIWAHNYVIGEGCWHSYWRDVDTGEVIQIPDLAWEKLNMAFEDVRYRSYEKGLGDESSS